MKWFKHISDSLDDPFIFELLERHGGDGYLVFFGLLEIYSREFKTELNWKLKITRAQLKAKFHKRQDKLLLNSLKFIKNSGKWEINIDDIYVTVYIPKFHEMVDEWTQRKLGSHSGVTPKKPKTNKIKILDKEKEKKEKKKVSHKYSDNFLEFWKAYPQKISKFKAYQSWKKLKADGELPELHVLINAINQQKHERQVQLSKGREPTFWKHPTTWLNQRCWEDEPEERPKAQVINIPKNETLEEADARVAAITKNLLSPMEG